MRVEYFCFVTAALAALGGMGLGIVMGLREDVLLAPVHAHLNLLGWVTMAIYGLYHRGADRSHRRLAWVQAGAGAAGFVLMTGGLAGLFLMGSGVFLPVAILGSLLVVTGMLLFLAIVIGDLVRDDLPTLDRGLRSVAVSF